MTRVPKFRAWDKKTECMSEVKLIDRYSDVAWLEDVVEHGMQFTAHRKFDDVILMQSTGLKDKNGVEIYESDVVEYKDGGTSFLGVVTYSAFGWFVEALEDNYSFEDFSDEQTMTSYVEVIGNIYVNK